MWRDYFRLMRWHKPIGFFLLLWPVLWALVLAGRGHFNFKITLVFLGGVVLMRSAGCVINDVADRNFDAQVARTRNRPLAQKIISTKQALILFFSLCLLAFFLVMQLNLFAVKLAFIGLLLAIIYPFMKRYTHWPQLFLGAAFNWGIPMVFAAQQNKIPGYAWVLYLAAVCWSVVYDTMYAMVDRADDIKVGIKSTAILFGSYDRFWIGQFQLLMLILLALAGIMANLNFIYYFSLGVAAIFFAYQQWLIKDRIPVRCFHAFQNNNYVGAVIFFVMLFALT